MQEPREISKESGESDNPKSNASSLEGRTSVQSRGSTSMKTQDWSQFRRQVHVVLQRTEFLVGFVVLTNFIFISIEVDINASPDPQKPGWLDWANTSFLIFYLVELSARFFVERYEFWKSGWNIFDFTIVTIGLVGEMVEGALDSVSMLRTLRLMRMLRLIRVLESFRELWYLVRDMIACLRTLGWAFLLILMMLTIWSIIAVEMLNDLAQEAHREGRYGGCDWCGHAFSSIMHANLTFFAILSGDGWSTLARPLIEEHPWTVILFLGVIFTMSFGLLNVLIAVMCENAAAGRLTDTAMMAAEKQEEKRKEQGKFLKLCKELDADDSGSLTLEEIKNAFDDVPEFAALLHVMDINAEDIDCVFHILDEDGSGDVSYEEFANQLWTMKTQEAKTLIMMVKYYVLQIWNKVSAHTQHLQTGYVAHTERTELAVKATHDEMKELLCENKCMHAEIYMLLTGKQVQPRVAMAGAPGAKACVPGSTDNNCAISHSGSGNNAVAQESSTRLIAKDVVVCRDERHGQPAPSIQGASKRLEISVHKLELDPEPNSPNIFNNLPEPARPLNHSNQARLVNHSNEARSVDFIDVSNVGAARAWPPMVGCCSNGTNVAVAGLIEMPETKPKKGAVTVV